MKRLIAVFLTVGVAAHTQARTPITTFEDLIGQSEVVVIGKVIEISPGPESEQYRVPTKIARVKVDAIPKGAVQSVISIVFDTAISEQPNLVVDKNYLLFLRSSPAGWRVVVGNLGAREIVNENVATEGIANEPNQIAVELAVARIAKAGK
jgi:hypothetical protein